MLEPPTNLTGLIEAWRASIYDIRDVASTLTEAQWRTATACPGWSVADVVAHVIDAESMIAGEPRADHEPNWDALPHVASDFGRMTEVGVDARRGRSAADLLSELETVIAVRERQLVTGPQDLSAEVPAFTAATLPLGRLLTMRTFDTWVHSQDIRDAVDQPGGMDAPGAQVAAGLMLQALPRIWGKTVAAPAGSVLSLDITGPGITETAAVEVMPDGRAAFTPAPSEPVGPGKVTVRGSWPAIMQLMTGRVQPGNPPRSGVEITGDTDLVSRVIPALNIAP